MPKGLEHLGIPGPDYISEQLSACQDPGEWIENFQAENNVLLPSLKPALPLLDLHDISRREFHQSLVDVLKDKLRTQLNVVVASDEKSKARGNDDRRSENNTVILTLVEKNFDLIDFEPLQDIMLDALSRLPEIPDNILDKLQKNKPVYKLCPVNVKRQIWQKNQSLFGDEISPMLSEYIKQKENILFSVETQKSVMNLKPKHRRQDSVIKKLTERIGSNIHLYDVILQFLRTLFLRTKNDHYCTLRTELLMNFHDEEKKQITNVDPCYRFTWCMDACLKEKEVDSKRAKQMQEFVHALKKDQNRVLGDLSMVICDPYTVHTLVNSIFKQLQSLAARKGQLPRRNDDSLLLMRLLTLGISAWDIIDKQNFKEPKVDPKLLTNFCPCLMCLIVDDSIQPVGENIEKMKKLIDPVSSLKTEQHAAKIKSQSASSSSGANGSVYDEEIHPAFTEGIENSKIAGLLAAAYLNHLARSGNKRALLRVFKCVLAADSELMYTDMFLHQFVFSLISLAESFCSDVQFRNFFIDFFTRKQKNDHVLRHCYRLLILLKTKLPKDVLKELSEKVAPSETHSAAVHELYSDVIK